MKIYCLFLGRHELPQNEGPIYSSWDFEKNTGVRTPLFNELVRNGGQLLVTGLTPALTEFLISFNLYWSSTFLLPPKLILLHYDSKTCEYWEQVYAE